MKRIAIVTGAARGIGKAIALEFAKTGTVPVLIDKDKDVLMDTVTEVKVLQSDALSFVCDVSDIPGFVDTIGSIAKAYNRIDILVNNAGILSKESIETITEEQWDRVMSINVKSAAFASGACIKHMITQRFGRIINISSMAARMGGISAGCAYSASKAAMIGLTRDIAKKYAKYGITANAVAPGTTKGEMSKGFTKQELDDLVEGIPVGCLTDPEDIAKVVVFLSQDTAKSITGAVFDINGGTFMG